MRSKVLLGAIPAFALLLITIPMFAHHGTAVYDSQNKIMLKGTLTKFDFGNPHILMYIDAPDKTGTMRNWVIEISPPSLATRSGWTKNMMKPGDTVAYQVQPAKNGAFVGRGASEITVNGKQLGR